MKQRELVDILDRVHAVRALVLGDVMLDRFVYGTVTRVSPEAPIPVIEIDHAVDSLGGAANVARNIAALGGRAVLLGVTGSDPCAADLQRELSFSSAIDARLVLDHERPTTVKTRYVADGQQMLRTDHEIRTELKTPVARALLARFRECLDDADVLVLSDYSKGVLSQQVVREAIDAACSARKPIVVDPKARDFSRYSGASILTPNRVELQNACGVECATDDSVASAALRFVEAGVCSAMVVTRGKDGMSVVTGKEPAVHLRTMAQQVFDVSGAGDTAVASIALGLATGSSIVAAATLGNLAAGIVVGKLGTAVVTASELIEQLSPVAVGDSKIFTLESVLGLTRSWREKGARIAFTNGCFDLVHPGHISLLEQARRSADRLVVGLNSDDSVRRLKGAARPLQNEIARATVLSSLKFVDAVVIFNEETPIELIHALGPDVLVKGADYTIEEVIGAQYVRDRGGKVILVDLVDAHSTTRIVRRAAEAKSS